MGNIKVIPDLEPWEVMKRASDGEPVAYSAKIGIHATTWKDAGSVASWNWEDFEFAIIDASRLINDWTKFNWGFFNKYGGLLVEYPERNGPVLVDFALPDESKGIPVESPFYYWPGGDQPVPDNVEVETIQRKGKVGLSLASDYNWNHRNNHSGDIIAFRITGDIL